MEGRKKVWSQWRNARDKSGQLFSQQYKKTSLSNQKKKKPQTKLQVTFSIAFKFLRKMTVFLKERPLVSAKYQPIKKSLFISEDQKFSEQNHFISNFAKY